MLNDPLANALSSALSYDKCGRKEVIINPVSRVIRKVFTILQDNFFVGSFDELSEARGGIIKLHLLGNVNACGVIKPKFSVTLDTYEKFEKRYLPAKDFGILIVSTSKGIMTHEEAKRAGIGGRLLAYCY
ncbi:MAG: 30S ribosomal protein S8 [Candidatus Aenigmarchaeota archaeon]|nr:30S ribosomal protein S8 [Candidatus Aenigmarchaeota archaeon]